MCVHATGKTYVMRCTMKELQQRLALAHSLEYIDRPLVNLNKVQSMEALPRGENCAVVAQRCALKSQS